ncbi:MAG: CoA transferase [Deltaproteobacteria bacterium]|nr:CoA transferase [Deltaproteobacteria bacterium]
MENTVLDGIKVLDFTWAALGPMTCDYLAVYGAEVIKVETSKRPDPWRTMSPFAGDEPGLDRAGNFAIANVGKYSIALNLKDARGIEVARKLVARADIVVESYTPGSMAELGLSYEDLIKIKPDIIMLSTCMYGQTGPLADLPGFGLTLTGASGISNLMGWPDRPPLPSGSYTDFVAPKFNVLAIISALDYRRRTGKGQYLDASQMEAVLHFVSPVLFDYTVNDRELSRVGNHSEYAAPHGVYHCQGENSFCAISVDNDEEWKVFCRVLGNEVLADDPRFSTLSARLENEDDLNLKIEEWTESRGAEEVMHLLQEAGISAGVAQSGEQLDSDPQLAHRGYYTELDHPEMGKMSYSGMSIKMSGTPYKLTRRSPLLGEHTAYVCTEILKMPDEEFVELLNDGVLE